MAQTIGLAPGRVCGNCSLCCKLPKIDAVQKPAGVWCSKFVLGTGCSIHATRPGECRHFDCLFLRDERLDEKWRPSKAKLFIAMDDNRIVAFVDPTSPVAWRKEPYYSRLKQWAKDGLARKVQVLVVIDKRTFAILPDRDVDLGNMAEDDRILYSQTGWPPQLEVIVVNKDDPRLTGGVANEPFAVLQR